MTLVKICGIREYEHAHVAAGAGASLIGFVFVPVRREIKPSDARSIIDRVRREHPRSPATVGLFVNQTAEQINAVVAESGIDFVQIHGDEPPELALQIDVPVIKALRVGHGVDGAALESTVRSYLETCAGVHIDSHVQGKWGGTGIVGDWDVASRIASRFPAVLAGGLDPENVAAAIQRVRPAVVDVSTGVETDGRKDPELIRDFIASARVASGRYAAVPAGDPLIAIIADIRDRHQKVYEIVSTPTRSRLN